MQLFVLIAAVLVVLGSCEVVDVKENNKATDENQTSPQRKKPKAIKVDCTATTKAECQQIDAQCQWCQGARRKEGTCHNVFWSKDRCGTCETKCSGSDLCGEGLCRKASSFSLNSVMQCKHAGGLWCSAEKGGLPVCVNPAADSAHCGRCDVKCEPGFKCTKGTCMKGQDEL
eukprot:TRINITY_DN54380_c0_g1_i1.p1 TRINITY_DN54380_c0_g1~~TRINITY_DN54380_c0_g1_i1.p1  ORF type:complete len:172 (+),score=19.86 TRINITY_DN54380_c0_g1_i1:18-533(+)